MQIGFNAEAMCGFHDVFYYNFFPFSQNKDNASKKKQDRRKCAFGVCAGLFVFEDGDGGDIPVHAPLMLQDVAQVSDTCF